MTISIDRVFTCDDAYAAAEVLREINAGHEAGASQAAADARLDELTTTQLENLCDIFGVEI
jgi:predicted DNA-binding protein